MDQSGAASAISVNALASALSTNLRVQAQKFESISALCRASGVNRQQFNKYLTGETLPSLYNLFKISNTIGISIDELLNVGATNLSTKVYNEITFGHLMEMHDTKLETGYYLEYIMSPIYRDKMLVSIVFIKKEKQGYKGRLKTIFQAESGNGRRYLNYSGPIFSSRDAIYINYVYESDPTDVTFSILQPDVRYSANLIGTRVAMSSSSPATPFAASFYMKYLGEKPDLRSTLRQCGVYPLEDLDEQHAKIFARLSAKTQNLVNTIRIGHS